ncbi:MAG: RNA polymerase sigma factor [Planctomycetes bacterium]|nr:RNA polymerase sigma factor [Planctomycetota bacterium]MCB9870083.1 RNA polymerase sigma factor [Planctomycetota bacterium]MCB9889518.1 RNA polymerase sigma factor [Planctomycetota bacterium]
MAASPTIAPADPVLTRETDDALMSRLAAGEVEPAIRQLQQRHRGRVQRLAERIVADRHLAEDVTQEVFAKVFLKAHLYEPGTSFRAWVLEITRNQALSAVRAARCRPRAITLLGLDDPAHDGDHGAGVLERAYEDRRSEEREFMRVFAAELAALPAPYREVFEQCVVAGRPYREVGAQLGLPIGTVAIRIMRARQRLFRQLGHHLGRLRRPPACVQ